VLRTGAANFGTSGERAQDNEVEIIRDAAATARFEAKFERLWAASADREPQ
jgi:hypothetical protein